ncbi:MAG TPA: outer membrane lipoprotein carrier protein LolA [Patescibacteria group bacterium]|nr:outer membrane lipoprotein carrier protein LolA [Patescibacteria group bacterium]
MRILAAILLALVLAVPAKAAMTDPANPMGDVAAVEAYLSGIKTLKAKFVQTDNEGKRIGGTFLLKRPGRMSFTYDPPVKDFIVADGTFINYYDAEMKQGSRTLISKSLADFFLREKLTLSGDLQVSTVKREGGMLLLTLVEKKEPNAGSMVLAFTEVPSLELRKWRIVDPGGSVTEVELFNTQTGVKLDNDLFHYYDPERSKGKLNK